MLTNVSAATVVLSAPLAPPQLTSMTIVTQSASHARTSLLIHSILVLLLQTLSVPTSAALVSTKLRLTPTARML